MFPLSIPYSIRHVTFPFIAHFFLSSLTNVVLPRSCLGPFTSLRLLPYPRYLVRYLDLLWQAFLRPLFCI